jgi:hypothetical protein
MNYEDIEQDQMKDLPSEADLPTPEQTGIDIYLANHQVVKRRDPRDPNRWKDLEDKAVRVYEDGLDADMDFKHRKAVADTVMEIQGRRGNKNDKGGGQTIIFSDDAAKNLVSGLSSLLALGS